MKLVVGFGFFFVLTSSFGVSQELKTCDESLTDFTTVFEQAIPVFEEEFIVDSEQVLIEQNLNFIGCNLTHFGVVSVAQSKFQIFSSDILRLDLNSNCSSDEAECYFSYCEPISESSSHHGEGGVGHHNVLAKHDIVTMYGFLPDHELKVGHDFQCCASIDFEDPEPHHFCEIDSLFSPQCSSIDTLIESVFEDALNVSSLEESSLFLGCNETHAQISILDNQIETILLEDLDQESSSCFFSSHGEKLAECVSVECLPLDEKDSENGEIDGETGFLQGYVLKAVYRNRCCGEQDDEEEAAVETVCETDGVIPQDEDLGGNEENGINPDIYLYLLTGALVLVVLVICGSIFMSKQNENDF